MTQSRIEAIGVHLPKESVSTASMVDRITPEFRIDVERITGVRERRVHSRDPELFEDSVSMATLAAQRCLAKSRYTADDIDIIITTSISRVTGGTIFCYEPGLSLFIRNALGAHQAKHFDITNACAGMTTGLLILDRMIKTGAVRRGMIVSGEQLSPSGETAIMEISSKYDPHFSSLTVGDAGAAVLVDDQGTAGDGVHFVDMMTSSEGAELCIGMPSNKHPGMAMYTDNRAMQTADRYLQAIRRLREMLTERGSTFADEEFDFIIHHQFSAPAIEKINAMMEHELQATQPTSLTSLQDFGNTTTTSHWVVLHNHLVDGTISRGDKVLLIPSASGTVSGTIAATLTEVGF